MSIVAKKEFIYAEVSPEVRSALMIEIGRRKANRIEPSNLKDIVGVAVKKWLKEEAPCEKTN